MEASFKDSFEVRKDISEFKLLRDEGQLQGNFTSVLGEYFIPELKKSGFYKANGCMLGANNDEDLRELLASKLLDKIGFPHADILLVKDDKMGNGCISVNILNDNEEFIESNMDSRNSTNSVLDFINNDLEQIALIPGITPQDIEKRKEYLIKYLFISALISNTDVKIDNMMIIRNNKTGEFRNPEYYDMGVAFIENDDRRFFMNFSANEIIEQLYSNYQDIISPFAKDIRDCLTQEMITKIIGEESFNEFLPEVRQEIAEQLQNRIEYIKKCETKTKNSIDMKKAEELYNDIKSKGIEALTDFLKDGDTLSERLKFDKQDDYLKKIILAQMNIDNMLLNHKYYSAGWELRDEFNLEADKIRNRVNSEQTLTLDSKIIESLFGNSLEIENIEQYNNWNEFMYMDKKFDRIFFEEEFKFNYENEKNPIKRFFQSFKYRSIVKNDLLEDSYMQKIRKMMREEINNNPENTFDAYRKVHTQLEKGICEYEMLNEAEDIAIMMLISLTVEQNKPIDIVQTCLNLRKEMTSEIGTTKKGTEFRRKQVTLGSNTGIQKGPIIETIPFEEVPNAIQKLQEEYEEAYNTCGEPEEFIKKSIKIYSDFIYIQPYEDGNKRTGLCLFNSMLISKGIKPPPISLINDEKMVEAFELAEQKDYTMLQDLVVNKYRSMQESGSSGKKIINQKDFDKTLE